MQPRGCYQIKMPSSTLRYSSALGERQPECAQDHTPGLKRAVAIDLGGPAVTFRRANLAE
jgi:hypothetical protein